MKIKKKTLVGCVAFLAAIALVWLVGGWAGALQVEKKNGDDDFVEFNPEKEGLKFRTKLLGEGKKLQAGLARGQRHPFLQVRLDRASLALDKTDPPKNVRVVQFQGVFFFFAEEDKESTRSRLKEWLQKECQSIPNPGGRKTTVDLSNVKAVPNPVIELQKRAIRDRFDGVLFETVWFEPDGSLQIHTHVGEPNIKDEIARLIPEVLGKGWTWKQSAEPLQTSEDRKALIWVDFKTRLQRHLSESKVGQHRQTRLDRAYFEYEGTLPKLFFEGVHLYLGEQAPDELVRDLNADLGAACKGVLDYPRDPVVKTDRIATRQSPIYALQKVAVADKLDGALWEQAWYTPDGTLQFGGVVGHSDQRKPLEKGMLALLAGSPALVPAGEKAPKWSTEKMTALTSSDGQTKLIWNQVLANWQKDLAEDEPSDSVFPTTRVDRSYFDYDGTIYKLFVEGVHLHKGKIPPDLSKSLNGRLQTVWKKHVFHPKDPVLRADGVRALETPIDVLQKAVIQERVDGVLFDHARYDAAGKLVFDGFIGSEKQAKLLLQIVADSLKGSRVISPAGIASLQSMKHLDWPRFMQGVQASLAADKAALYRQTRIDRGFFDRDPASRKVRVGFQGLCMHSTLDLDQKQRMKRLEEKAHLLLQRDKLNFEEDLSGILFLEDPKHALQDLIYKNDLLDGVVIDLSYFNANGELKFIGFFADTSKQKPLFDELLKKHLKDSPLQKPAIPVPSDGMESWDWPQLLRQVQGRLASASESLFQETRVARARFKYGRGQPIPDLYFEGVCLNGPEAATAREMLAKYLETCKDIFGLDFTARAERIAFHRNPTISLQETAVLQRLDGLFFRQARFDSKGSLQLAILLPHEIGEKKLAKLLEDQAIPQEISPTKAELKIEGIAWQPTLHSFQKRLASHADPVYQRTRLVRAYFAYGKEGKALLHAEGLCIHPLLGDEDARPMALKSLLAEFVPSINYSPSVEKVIFSPNPMLALQEEAIARKLHGVLFEDGSFDGDGKLRLRILLPELAHSKSVNELIHSYRWPDILSSSLDEKTKGPVIVVRTFPWSDMLNEQQARLAVASDQELRQTRVDDAHFAYDRKSSVVKLHFLGIFLGTGDQNEGNVRKRLAEFLTPVVPNVTYESTVDKVVMLSSPILALQKEVSARKLEGVLFSHARYDAEKKLHIDIVTPKELSPKTIHAILTKHPPTAPAIPDGQQAIPHIRLIDWGEVFQRFRGLHEGEPVGQKIRLDRGQFFFSEKGTLQFHIQGVSLTSVDDAFLKEAQKRFQKSIAVAIAQKLNLSAVSVHPEIKALSVPLPRLQAQIAADEKLDGMWIEEFLFGPKGRLEVRGVWRSKDQMKAVHGLVQDFLEKQVANVLDQGLHWTHMSEVRTDLILQELREWCADNNDVEEVLLQRIYFDAEGRLKIKGMFTRDEDQEKILQRFNKIIERTPLRDFRKQSKNKTKLGSGHSQRQLAFYGGNGSVVADQEGITFAQEPETGAVVLDLEKVPSLTAYLQSKLHLHQEMDGLRLDLNQA